MAMPPYGRRVMAMPEGYRRRGTRIFVFAGDDAWKCTRQYLETGEIHEGRERYVLVAPASMPDRESKLEKPFRPFACSWPVRGFTVLVIDCGLSEKLRDELVMALKRDGASEGLIVGYPEHQPDIVLSNLQLWSHADWWDATLQHPAETPTFWRTVTAMRDFLERCTLTEFNLEVIREFLAAPDGSAGAIALCDAWRRGELRDRLQARAALARG